MKANKEKRIYVHLMGESDGLVDHTFLYRGTITSDTIEDMKTEFLDDYQSSYPNTADNFLPEQFILKNSSSKELTTDMLMKLKNKSDVFIKLAHKKTLTSKKASHTSQKVPISSKKRKMYVHLMGKKKIIRSC